MTTGDHVRAAVIALALFAHGIYALPLPPAVNPGTLQEDWRQRDIRLWRSWLESIGLDVTHQQIEQQLMFWTGLTGRLHRALKTPFRPLFQLTASNQAWALFAAASTQPETVVVQVRELDGTWRTIARRLDPDATWKADVLRYRRIRGVWDGQKRRTRRTYKDLSKWLADEAFAEMPEISEVQVYIEQGRSVYPWEEPNPMVLKRHRQRHRRSVE